MGFLTSPNRLWLGLLLSFILAAAAVASVPPVITIETGHGDVTFAHRDHQVRAKGQCVQCHHEGAGVHSCRSCHDGERAPIAREVVHQMCKGCHNEQGGTASPMQCEGCHGG
ncbi:MAG: hypothetical protein C0624_01315 [Desulfuromonas sp.]|nr:MAG: hypothetical protein C0624_01315 [Desulfuromonas sp.]